MSSKTDDREVEGGLRVGMELSGVHHHSICLLQGAYLLSNLEKYIAFLVAQFVNFACFAFLVGNL